MILDLTRPIIGIENRTAQEVFDIMSDRIRAHISAPPDGEVGELAGRLQQRADTMNGSLAGASDGAIYTLGYYDQFAARDDRQAATALTSLSALSLRATGGE